MAMSIGAMMVQKMIEQYERNLENTPPTPNETETNEEKEE